MVFLMAPWLVFASSPIMPHIGVWYQSESLIVAVLALSTLCALGLFCGLLSAKRQMQKNVVVSVLHPSVVLPALIFIWSIVMMPFAEFPLLSFYGAPQTGTGAVWFLEIALLIGGFRFLFSSPVGRELRGFLSGYLLIAALGMTVLGVYGTGDWRPFFYTDYLAFIGIFTWMTVTAFDVKRGVLSIIAVLICGFILYISENRTAYAVLILIPVIFAIGGATKKSLPRGLDRYLFGLIPISILIAVPLLVGLIGFSDYASELHQTVKGTIKSRALMLDIVQSSLTNDAWQFLSGEGWGRFSTAMLEEVPYTETKLYNDGVAVGDHLWFWDSLRRFDFDSHNLLSEAILGAGIPAGLCLVVWLGWTVGSAQRSNLFVTSAGISAFALVSGFWFQIPLTVPFMGMALAAVSGRTLRHKDKWLSRKWVPIAGLILSIPILIGATIEYGSFSIRAARAVEANYINPENITSTAETNIIRDESHGHYHFTELMKNFVVIIKTALQSGEKLSPWQIDRLELLMAEADIRIDQNPPIHLAIRALNARSDLVFFNKNNQLGTLFDDRIKDWGAILDKVLYRFPQREDIAIAYFLWLLDQGKEQELLTRAEALLAQYASSPIGLWFSGVVILGDTSRANDGMLRLKQAIQNGVERYMPIDKNIKESIKTKG